MIQYSIHLPRLCDRTTLQEIARLHPTKLSVTENEAPLSTAQMELPAEDQTVTVGQFVELYDAHRSLGFYRVAEVHRRYRAGVMQTVYLEHALATLANDVVFGGVTYNSGAQTARAVLLGLLGRQSVPYWTLWDDAGTAEDLAYLDSQTNEFYFENQDLLQALLDFAATLPKDLYIDTDMSVFPWRLIPRALPTEATSEARLGRNIESLKIGYDWNSLCTRLYPRGSSSGENDLTIAGAAENPAGLLYIDSDTQGTWGIISQIWQDSDAASADALYTKAKKHLETVKNPVVSITLEGHDLSGATGEDLDSFECGQPCRVTIPEDGVNLTLRILTVEHPDLITDPARIVLTIGTADKRKASRQKAQQSSGGGGGGGGGGRTTTETFTLVGSKTMGVDYFSFGSFNLGSEWKSVKSVSAKLEYITISGAPDFDLYADGKYVQHIAGDASLTLTSYLRYSGGEIARGNHYLTARNADDPDASYSIRITVTVKGVKSQSSQTEE